MGCSISKGSRRSSKSTVVDDVPRSSAEDIYLSLKRRTGTPNSYKSDGYELGLCVRDNVCGVYSLYCGTAKATNEKVSIKQFYLQRYDPRLVTEEVANLALLSHECFPQLHEMFHTDSSVYMVTSYIDMFRLKNYIDLRSNITTLSMAEVRKIFVSLVNAVAYAHDEHIILRSLLPENIAVRRLENKTSEMETSLSGVKIEVKICDVGLAVQVTQAKSAVYSGHPLYEHSHVNFLAPEVALKLPYSFSCDIWGLGVLLYLMVAARLPFSVDDPMDRALLLQRIKDGEFVFEPKEVWQDMRKEIKQLICSMLVTDPLARATIPEIRRNAWVMNG